MQGLKNKRKNRKLTQSELAKEVGTGKSTVSSWETGQAFPRKEHLDKLCKFFDCKIDDLI